MSDDIRSVVVFGGAGYLGSTVSECLVDAGYQVTIFDRLSFGREPIADLVDSERCRLIQSDTRDAAEVARAVKDHDAVILLAALVSDKACARDPEDTVSINVMGSLNILEACRYYGSKRFIFASTDSCYGTQTGIINELNPLLPISLYGETKQLIEQRILRAWDEERGKPSVRTGKLPGFGPVILRMGTLYGLSKRMRFDLVLNILTWKACTGDPITIYGGEQWRPMVHVRDAAEAYVHALKAPDELVLGQVFNVGSNEQNIQIKDLGQTVSDVFPEVETEWVDQPPDLRDYYVDFSKITRVIGWKAQRTMESGIKEIQESIASGIYDPENMELYQNN